MDIKYRGHTKRQKEAREMWLRVATDYNGGIPPKEIAKRYNITKSHLYWILKKVQELPIN